LWLPSRRCGNLDETAITRNGRSVSMQTSTSDGNDPPRQAIHIYLDLGLDRLHEACRLDRLAALASKRQTVTTVFVGATSQDEIIRMHQGGCRAGHDGLLDSEKSSDALDVCKPGCHRSQDELLDRRDGLFVDDEQLD